MIQFEDDQVNVEQIMERIRQRAEMRRRKTSEGSASDSLPSNPRPNMVLAKASRINLSGLRLQLGIINQTWSGIGSVNARPPGTVNDLIQFTKRLIARVLGWQFRSQLTFNASTTRYLNEMIEILEHFNMQTLAASREFAQCVDTLRRETIQKQAELDQQLQTLHASLAQTETARTQDREQLGQDLTALRQEQDSIAKFQRRIQDNRVLEQLRLVQRDVRKLKYVPPLQPSKLSKLRRSVSQPSPQEEREFDYFWFEERFRGDEAEIRERQRIYVDYFRGRQDVVDLGCGRGEFLELLRENDIPARGVDSNLDMVLICQDKGLKVNDGDLLEVLASEPDESLGGIFSAQVIEHLTTRQLMQLLVLCSQKLQPGGALLLETVNPQCLMVFARSFTMDLTHIHPVHPLTLQFLLEWAGFQRLEAKYLSPVEPGWQLPPLPAYGDHRDDLKTFNERLERLNQLLYGYQDYAVVGYKQ